MDDGRLDASLSCIDNPGDVTSETLAALAAVTEDLEFTRSATRSITGRRIG